MTYDTADFVNIIFTKLLPFTLVNLVVDCLYVFCKTIIKEKVML